MAEATPEGLRFRLDPDTCDPKTREAFVNAMLKDTRIGLNIEALEKVTGRTFTAAEKEEITTKTQRAWRWTFLVSGLEHPNVVKTVDALTTEGSGKIKKVAEVLSA